MSSVAFPFVRIPAATVTASPWLIEVNGEPGRAVDGRIGGWDYASGLRVIRSIDVDLDAAAKTLGLARADLELGLVVSLGTGTPRGERRKRIAFSATLSGRASSATVAFQPKSYELSQSIRLVTDLILISEHHASGVLAPRHRGSRLWQDSALFYIEPESARFPIEAVSFSKIFKDYPQGALFHLSITNPDYDQEFSSSVRLLINADDLAFCEKVSSGDEIVLRLVLSSIVIQMVRAALDNEGFSLQTTDSPASSIGGVVRNWIRSAFPDQSLETVRAIASHSPAVFETALSTLSSEPIQ